MSSQHMPTHSPSSEEPVAEYVAEQPMGTRPLVRMNEEYHLSVQTGNHNVESTGMGRICKTMCVTTNGALMVIAWTIAAMTFTGLSAYGFSLHFPLIIIAIF